MQISFAPILLSQPDDNRVEISLFGPGIGECIVLHFGDGRWFIVDSCRCPETNQPIALKYLKSIGVNVSQQVKGILITHWHRDHINGALEILKECESARLYHSMALSTREAFNLAALYKKDLFANTDQEIREFGGIVQYLFETGDRERFEPVKAKSLIFDLREGMETRMIALSPSSTAVTQSVANLVNATPAEGAKRTRNIVRESENLNAVAIHFSFGEFSAVLGSDLEDTGNIRTGWSAVFHDDLVGEMSLSPSSVYKVSHHGSSNGHHDEIWSRLLNSNPLSIATPFTSSGLPTDERIVDIAAHSSELLVTRNPRSSRRVRRENMVDRELKAIVKTQKTLNDRMGHIQIRASSTGELNIAGSEVSVRFS
jgi:Metallo-beta-lactamase superfamily